MARKKKSAQAQIRELKAQIKRLQDREEELLEDRRLYRDWVTAKLKWFIQLQGEGKGPSVPFLIEDIAKLLSRAKNFYW